MRKLICLVILVLCCGSGLPAQDPVTTDPAHYRVVYENDQLRVLMVKYGPGEKSPLHQHPAAMAIALTDRHERTTPAGKGPQEITAKAGSFGFGGGKHTAENLDTKPFEALLIEYKTPQAASALRDALSGVMKDAMMANERSALAYTRTLNTAEVTYASIYKKGFTDGLNRMGPPAAGAQPDENHSDLLQPWLAGLTEGGTNNTAIRNGYKLTYAPGAGEPFGSIKTYTITAVPLQHGCSGTTSYFTDETAVIRWTRENRPATRQDPDIGTMK